MENKILRTPMAQAIIDAQHKASAERHNTGNVGRVVLTNEAKGVGVIWCPKAKKSVIDRSNKVAA